MSQHASGQNALTRFASDHPLWLVFLTAIVVRTFNILLIWYTGGEFMIEDSSLYPVIAQDWMKSLGLLSGEPLDVGYVERTPLYPVFIGLMQLIGLGHPIHFVLANSIFDASTCVLVAMLGGMLNRWVGLVAGLVAAFWPNLIVHSGLVLTDSLFVLLMTGVILAAARFIVAPSAKLAGITGLLLGMAILTRAIAQFLPIPVSIVLLVAARRNSCSWRQTVLMACTQLIAVAVLVVPIQIHNKERFDSYSLTHQAGTHLLYWVVPAVHEIEFGTPKAERAALMHKMLLERLKSKGLTPEQIGTFGVSKEQTQLALEMLGQSSTVSIVRAWWNGFVFNLATPAVLIDPRIRSLSVHSFYDLHAGSMLAKIQRYVSHNGIWYILAFTGGGLGSIATLIGSALGFVYLSRRQWAMALIAFLIILYFLAINGPVASPKYRLPFEPVLILLTAIGAFAIWERFAFPNRDNSIR